MIQQLIWTKTNLLFYQFSYKSTWIQGKDTVGWTPASREIYQTPCKSWEFSTNLNWSTVSLNDHNMHRLVFCLSIRTSEITHDNFINYLECLQTILLQPSKLT